MTKQNILVRILFVSFIISLLVTMGCDMNESISTNNTINKNLNNEIITQKYFNPGSIIIPMDTTYQDNGMFKAYGLIYSLLHNDIPVYRAIKKGKGFQEVDFTTDSKDYNTNNLITSFEYCGGPFVIDQVDADDAETVIDEWQSNNPSVAVHVNTEAFIADIAVHLKNAPKIALFADGNEAIIRGYLSAAGIPDSNGDDSWPSSSPDVLDITEVSGGTIIHNDGALFDTNGNPKYSHFVTGHWNTNDASSNPEVIAEVNDFLKNSNTTLFASCCSVISFENHSEHGHFLTPNGFDSTLSTSPGSYSFNNNDSLFAQFDGSFTNENGSYPAYTLPVGDSYLKSGISIISASDYDEGSYDIWITGKYKNNNSYGTVCYLGGHQYDTLLPISANSSSQGTCLFLNSIFN